MKTLTLTQPWATLVASGAKMIETRSWATSYRGRLAIHAAKGFPLWAQEMCVTEPFATVLARLGIADPHDLVTGHVVATCDLVSCVPITALSYTVSSLDVVSTLGAPVTIPPAGNELAFGNYAPGRYAWLLADINRLAEPVLAKGALGLWDWVPLAAGQEV